MADYDYGANDFGSLDAGMGTYDTSNFGRSVTASNANDSGNFYENDGTSTTTGGGYYNPNVGNVYYENSGATSTDTGSGGVFASNAGSPAAETNPSLTSQINSLLGTNYSGRQLASMAAVTGGGIAGLVGALNPSSAPRSGYQGGIPRYDAVRTMTNAPPTRAQGYRPGQGGINYGGDVSYIQRGISGAGGGGSSGGGGGGGGGSSIVGDLAKAGAVGGLGYLAGQALSGALGNRPQSGGSTTRPQSGGSAGSGVAQGVGQGIAKGVTGGGGTVGAGGGSKPAVEPAPPKDEFTDIDEQIRANEMGPQLPPLLSDEEIQAELDRLAEESRNEYQPVEEPVYEPPVYVYEPPYMPTYDEIYEPYTEDFDYTDYSFAKGGNVPRYLQGETDGMADKIPAKIGRDQPAALSHGEFVVPADVVSHLGNGNSDAGAKKLYSMMDKIRQARTGTKQQGKKINPDKFMPGGLAQAYAKGGAVKRFAVGGATAIPTGLLGTDQAPASWAGEYVTGMLGQGQALANAPYQQYGGPLTAGESGLQSKVFGGLQNINFPSNLGQSFSASGAPAIGDRNAPAGSTGGIASQYMNPYLQSVLDPQMAELRRQNDITNMAANAKLTQAGAYGGGRQAIMNAENNRNLMAEMNKTVGQGYATAYDKAMNQFNTEQGQGIGLANLLSNQGAQQRGIEAEGIAADKAAFEQARENPYRMVQFQQSLLNGLPIAAQNYNYQQPDWLTGAAQGATTVNKLLNTLGLGTTSPTTTPKQ